MTISKFRPTSDKRPSNDHRGANAPEDVYVEVGRALHHWEHMESALIRLYQVFCESKSIAACRAYGALDSSFTRHQLLHKAAEAFFGTRTPFDVTNEADTKTLLASYQTALSYRNNIAHGMTVGFHLEDGSHSGYFLSPPSYASKKVQRHATTVVYLKGAGYSYSVADLKHYAAEFTKLLNEAVRIAHLLNDKYKVLALEELHP